MRNKQFILILTFIGISTTLFFFGKRGLTLEEALQKKEAKAQEMLADENSSETLPESNLDFEQIVINLKSRLKPKELADITALEKPLESQDASSHLAAHEKLAAEWERLGYVEVASYYYSKTAETKPSLKNWEKAGDTYSMSFKIAQDSILVNYYLQNAINAYKKAVSFGPENTDLQIKLAECYIDSQLDIMKGVFALRDITQKDSTNAKANLILGRMAIVSTQYDKAVKRLQTVIQEDEKNAEAYYYLGEAYMGLGKKEEAVTAFEQCKVLVDSPNFLKQLDKMIENILKN